MQPKNKLPHNIHAERSLLGYLLKHPTSFTTIEETMRSEFFYDKKHQQIFTACSYLHTHHLPIDLVSVYEQLKEHQTDIGGMPYLESLFEEVSTENIQYYADLIKRKYFFRNTIDGASALLDFAYSEKEPELEKSIDELEQRIQLLSTQRGRLEQLHISSYVTSVLHTLSNASQTIGIPTGLQSLDSIICGFARKNLIILAARPSVGKTAMAINMALAALNDGKRVGFISMEMTGDEISLRMLSILTEIDAYKFKTANITSNEWHSLTQQAGKLVEKPLHIEERGSLSSLDIRGLARQMKREQGLDILFVDYLQLMREKGKQENRNLEVSQISGALKALAKELDIPVVALSQLSRQLEKRENKKPMLSDLRDSGSIEQDADIVLFLHREYLYDKEADPNHAELIIAKHRNGSTGEIHLNFYPQLTLFTDR